MRNQWLSSARARFLATAATVFALVALGGVTAAPAVAGAAGLYVRDASTGQPWSDTFALTNVDNGTVEYISTDYPDGRWARYILDGNYTLSAMYSSYVPSDVFYIGDGYQTISLDTYKVSGTINSDAGGGLTTASVEYYNGTVWSPVGATLDPTTVSASDGSFVFRAPQGPADYRLRLQPAASTGYVETFVPFTITGSSPRVTDLGAISLNVPRSISGSVFAADGITPVNGATVHASLSGTDIATALTNVDGEYLIALPATDADYTVTATGTGYFAQEWDASVAGSEVVSVNGTAGVARTGINFALDVEVVPIGGTVLNSNFFGSALYAQLWAGGTATPTLIEEVEVTRAGGEYVFSSAPTTGTYFIKFRVSGNDAFLDTLLGAGGHSEWSRDAATDSAFSTAHSFTVSVADVAGYADNDVTIEQGVLFFGYLSGGNNLPVDGCVDVIDLDDPTFALCAQPDADDHWAVRVPVGHRYKFHAIENLGEYSEQWWQNADNETDATPVLAAYGGFYEVVNFSLAPAPASLYAHVRDVTDTDPITVFLYVYANGTWTEVASHTTAPGLEEVYFDENWFNGYEGLAVGDYRVRFQDSNGMWLAANSHVTGRMPDDVGNAPLTDVTCYLDINDIAQGRPYFVDATFDAANQDPAACGPQPVDYRKVSGEVVFLPEPDPINDPTPAPVPVANHAIGFFNDDNSAYGTTNADGTFTVNSVPVGSFDVEVYPTTHVLGSHEYIYSGTGFVFNAGNVVLDDPLEASRLGNAYGTISNWNNTTMAGATATVYRLVNDPAGNYWQPGYVSVPISSTGYFETPGISVDGYYAVRVDFPTLSGFAPVFLNGGYPTPTSPLVEGDAGEDLEFTAPTVNPGGFVTISGSVFFGTNPLEYGVVIAHPIGDVCSCEIFGAQVDADGNYSFEVPANTSYEIGAKSPYQQILDQTYNGRNYAWNDPGPFLFDPLVVGSTDIVGQNFSLVASDEVYFDISTYTSDDYDYMAGVDIHIYKYVVDGWEEVATVTSDADAWAELEDLDGGDYRFRFSQGGDWLAVNEVYGESSYPFEDDVDLSDVYATPQCAVDVSDVAPGSYVYTEFYLIEDSTVGNCGPEVVAEHYDVFGSTVQSDVFNNDPIAGQTVTLATGSGATRVEITKTTDSQGLYLFEGISPGTYTLTVPTVVASNGRAYVGYTQTVVVDSDEALDPIKLTRYGNAEVGIYNWDPSMAGAIAHLEIEGPAGVWTPIGISDVVDAGMFVIPGISVDGNYRISIDYPAAFVDGAAKDFYVPSIDAVLFGTGEYDLGGTAVRAFTTVSGTVRLGANAVTGATVRFQAWAGGYQFSTLTSSSGAYSVAVPAGGTYTVYGEKTGLVRDVLTTEAVAFVPRTGVNLSMKYSTFFIETFAGTDPLTAHLYRKVVGGWQEVISDTNIEVMLWSTLSGDYRLRFSDGADWLAVSEYEINGGTPVLPVPNACYIDFAPAVGGSEYEILIEPVAPTAGAECAAEPAVVAPPVTPGTSGSGTKKPVATFTEEAATPTPTETPTPTDEPSDTPSDEPSDVEDCCAASSAPDFTWAFWAAGIVALLVLAGGAVYFVRRRP